MKNQKGVTLISLIITIILIMILTSVGIFTGFETYENMRAQAFVAKMKTVQEALDKLCEKYTIDEINNMGVDFASAPTEGKQILNNIIQENVNLKSWSAIDSINGNYRYFDINSINTILGIKDFDTAIWINPTSRNIIAIEGVEYENIIYYRQYDLPGGQMLTEPNVNVNFTLSYSVKTYDNKAEIILQKDNNETIFSNVKYYKQKDNSTEYGDAKILNNVSKITLSETGVYKVEATDSTGNTQRQEGIIVTIVNKPLLVDGMTPVKFIDNDNDGQEDEMVNTSVNDKDWYNYGESVKKWANATLKDGSVFVWIPRYAYEIDATNKKINIEFLKEFSQIGTDGKAIPTTYKVAPAFQNGLQNGYANGEWDNEITGIWVAKYEPINVSSNPKISASENVQCWREITPADAFNYCRYMESTNKSTYFGDKVVAASGTYAYGQYLNDSNNIDTHLMKNSEWGAVAYLTYSRYGETVSKTESYYVQENTATSYSSTNNYTGIYALNGGAYDMVSAATTISGYFNSENKSTKYATVYVNSLENNNIYGDAVKETSGWNSNTSDYPTGSSDYFRRGINGIFSYNKCSFNTNSGSSSDTTFRPVLIVEY